MSDLDHMEPLEADDIIVGESYLVVTVTLEGELRLSRVKVLSEPDDEGWFRSVDTTLVSVDGDRVGPPDSWEDESNLAGMGCYLDDEEYPFDTDRSFADTPANLIILTRLVQSQDTFGWLRFIGEYDPEEALAEMRRQVDTLAKYRDEPESSPALPDKPVYH